MDVIKIVFLLLIINYSESYQDNSCTTPIGKNGKCIALKECPTMIEFLNKAPKPYSDELKKLLREYVCSYETAAVDTRICCPSEPLEVSGKNIEEIPPPPDVSKHENLKLLPEECGYITIGDKIRGGTNAGFNEFPWMALLAYKTDTGREFKCGGTIINERYILTAAHCVVDTPYRIVGVRVGEYSLLSEKDCNPVNSEQCLPPPLDLPVEETIAHPEYSTESYANDIALLRVPKMNLDADNVEAVCLPVYEEILDQKYSKGEVTGWGFTDPYGQNVVDILQKVTLNVTDMSLCREAYKVQPSIKLSYKQICVGGENEKDSCGGDSGGPYQIAAHLNEESRYVQRGVVSIGHRFCGTAGFPGVYTSVIYYAKWILDNLKP